MVHIWHEDSERSSTTQFWEFLRDNNISPKLRNAEIKGFSGNRLLLNHLKDCITTGNINPNDVYIIFADNVADNPIVMRYYIQIKNMASSYNNIHVQRLLSFEYLMLKFKYLTTWTDRNYNDRKYAEAKQLRDIIIDIVDNNRSWNTSRQLVEYVIKYGTISTTTTPSTPSTSTEVANNNQTTSGNTSSSGGSTSSTNNTGGSTGSSTGSTSSSGGSLPAGWIPDDQLIWATEESNADGFGMSDDFVDDDALHSDIDIH